MTKPLRIKLALVLCAILSVAGLASADERGIKINSRPENAAQAEQRIALVIGNGAYDASPLRNPVNDARAMANVLRGLGFDVVEKENVNQKEMKKEIQSFGQRIQKGGVGLFYFAGHGMQVSGRNYLIPVGADIEHEKQVEYEAVDVGMVLAGMDYAHNRLNIVILDACRDNPFARSFRSSAQGLASINAPTGTLVAYATAPGSVAIDGSGENGIFTGEVVKALQQSGLKIEDVFKQVRSAVRELTQGRQVPWESSSLEGDFYFAGPAPAVSPAQEAAPAFAPERTAAASVRTTPTRSDNVVRAQKSWKEPITGIEFVWVPGGCYLMGSPTQEEYREPDESPVHEVCVDGYWIGRTEVTNSQFRSFFRSHDSKDYQGLSLNGDNQPAVYVSWEDANSFAQWLTAQNGSQYRFRLPTEAEWEYACRGGIEASRYWGNDPDRACEYENVADQTSQKRWGWDDVHGCDDGYGGTAPVGTFQPNPFGLYDMLGNVWEWCLDSYTVDAYVKHERKNPLYANEGTGYDRVVRGSYWHGGPGEVRCADRGSGFFQAVSDDLGFRLVREP